jgi:broad specificity phosphatase PhoE
MTTSIFIIRHGEVYNPKGILYGRLPYFGLSKKGREELTQTAKFLQDKNISKIYTSPMLRARQSATIIQKELKLPRIHTTKQLIEVSTSFQGKRFSDLSPDQSEVYLSPLRKKTDETVEQIATRLQKSIQSIINHNRGKNIVLLSHGDPIMATAAAIKKLPLDYKAVRVKPYIQHGEVWKITDDGEKQTIKSVFIPKV